MAASLDIVFPLYPGASFLDFMGPQAVLLPVPGARLIFASVGGQPIREGALTLSALTRLEDVERCDVICVPGGPCAEVLRDETFMAALRRLGGSARYVTSVCTGSLLLAAELTDSVFAQAVQLLVEYAPEPPFHSGRPDIAPKEVMARLGSAFGGFGLEEDRVQIQRRAAELRGARA